MKKIICLLLVLSCLSVSAFAADSITVGEVKEEDKAVTVNFTVTNLQADDEVTILVYKKEIDEEKSTEDAKVYKEPDETNIKYINQVTPQNNVISFNLLTDTADGLYEVRMGGTGIENASAGTFTISSIIYGDVTGNGVVDLSDAVWVLKYSSQFEMPTDEGFNIMSGDVTGNGVVDLSDAVWILKYASDFEIPEDVRLPKK